MTSNEFGRLIMTYVSPDRSSFFITIFSIILVINKHSMQFVLLDCFRAHICVAPLLSSSLFFSLTHSTSRSLTHFVFLSLSLSLSRSYRINLVKRKSRRCNNSVVLVMIRLVSFVLLSSSSQSHQHQG